MEALPEFTLHRPDSIEDAVALLASEPTARLVAGGTDLIVNMRRGLVDTPQLVDLRGIAELHEIEDSGTKVRLGAAVTLDRLAGDPVLQDRFPAIAQAAAAVAGATHRNVATLGGNLCLDTRCLFYNQSEWWRQSNQYCLKYRGDTCHVAPKSKRCFAVFSGDVAPALLVHEATVAVAGPDGRREMPLADLYGEDGETYLTLSPGEIVTSVTVPGDDAVSAYRKARIRGSIDFPLAGVAVALEMQDGTIRSLAAALTACDTKPFLVAKLGDFIGRQVDDETASAFGEAVQQQARPMRTTTATPWYRRRVVARLASRLLRELAEQ